MTRVLHRGCPAEVPGVLGTYDGPMRGGDVVRSDLFTFPDGTRPIPGSAFLLRCPACGASIRRATECRPEEADPKGLAAGAHTGVLRWHWRESGTGSWHLLTPTRPECFERALEFIGEPEARELRDYIEALELACVGARQAT